MTELVPVACFIVGALFGAWLYGRGRSGLSPLPRPAEIGAAFKGEPKEEVPEVGTLKFPEVKP
jgi:hypothetical protein